MLRLIQLHIQWNSMRYLAIILTLFICFDVAGQMGSTLRPNRNRLCDERNFINDHPNLFFVFSLQRLSDCYEGNCIRVRRSSDDAEQDIAFLNDYVDTAAIKTFVGSDTGYVVVYYDQVDTADMEPTIFGLETGYIMVGGNLVYNKGEVAIKMGNQDGPGNQLSPITPATLDETEADGYTELIVFEITDTFTNTTDLTTIGSRTSYYYNRSGFTESFVNTTGIFTAQYANKSQAGIFGNEYISVGISNAIDSTSSIYINNVAGTGGTTQGAFVIEPRFSANSEESALYGYFKEYIIWKEDKTAEVSDIFAHRNAFYNTY